MSGPQKGKDNIKVKWTLGSLQPGQWETQAQTGAWNVGLRPLSYVARSREPASCLCVTCQHCPTR